MIFKTRWCRSVSMIVLSMAVAACAVNSGPASAATNCSVRDQAQQGSLSHQGRERSYRLYIPATADSSKPLPLIVALHGGWGTGELMAEQTGLDKAAARRGFAVVYPDGVSRAWNAGRCCGKPMEEKVDDVGFIQKLVDQLSGASCIDDQRVYGTGFSNGAMMTHRIACEAPGLFTAIAPVAGGPMIDACPDKPAIPALLMVGRQDERIPWKGGNFKDSYRPSIAEQVKVLARRNRCDEESTPLKMLGGDCQSRRGCGDAVVQWCVLDGIGHQWPGGKTYLKGLLGPNRNNIDATETILEFFSAQTG